MYMLQTVTLFPLFIKSRYYPLLIVIISLFDSNLLYFLFYSTLFRFILWVHDSGTWKYTGWANWYGDPIYSFPLGILIRALGQNWTRLSSEIKMHRCRSIKYTNPLLLSYKTMQNKTLQNCVSKQMWINFRVTCNNRFAVITCTF